MFNDALQEKIILTAKKKPEGNKKLFSSTLRLFCCGFKNHGMPL